MEIGDPEFDRLCDYIGRRYGIRLRTRRHIVEGRLAARVLELGFTGFRDYLRSAFEPESPEEIERIVCRLTTNYSFFMREPEHFHYFADHVVPSLEERLRDRGRDLRIWSAGCATGEEPYALAMLLSDHFGPRTGLWDTTVLATDISREALEAAESGIYGRSAVERLPDAWRYRYFRQLDDERWRVVDPIRSQVVFRSHNLVDPVFPFRRRFHVIFCRNVMIYFENEARHSLVARFHEALEPGGYLFLGHSESIRHPSSPFRYVMPAVYRKEP